jgi:hypothetical protein
VTKRLVGTDGGVRPAGDQRNLQFAQLRGQRIRRLNVQRLQVQPDEIGGKRAYPRGDLVRAANGSGRGRIQDRDLVAARAQGRRQVSEGEERRAHRLRRRRVQQKDARHGFRIREPAGLLRTQLFRRSFR